ncbi:hypothetical protein F5Y18DRAFT_93125 [Xylariaceae sp. FL1019]|nr:hypothetical protein F5Y18DRAFT_93125 [Xylariaceae sp. FL1019]
MTTVSIDTPRPAGVHNYTVTGSTSGVFIAPTGIPLTTVFTPEPGCMSNWWYDPARPDSVDNGSRDQYNRWWLNCLPYHEELFEFSPGICPSGQVFKTVVENRIHILTEDKFYTFYAATCCFSQFTCGRNNDYCYTPFTSPLTVRYYDSVISASSLTQTTTVLTTPIKGVVFRNPTIYWQPKDISSFPESLAASLRVAMGLPAFTSNPSATALSPSSTILPVTILPSTTIPTTSSQGSSLSSSSNSAANSERAAISLSRGAIAGISIGAVIVLLFVGIMGFLAMSRRWLRNKEEQEGQPAEAAEMDQENSVYKHFSGGAWRSELDSRSRSELQGGISNMDSRIVQAPKELPASTPEPPKAVSEACEEVLDRDRLSTK